MDKIKSARFWAMVLTTLGSTALVFFGAGLLIRANEYAIAVALIMSYINNWGIILTFYFTRSRVNENPLFKHKTTE